MSEDDVARLACLSGIEITPGHMPGVIRNLEILQVQIALLAEEPLAPEIEPAAVFRP